MAFYKQTPGTSLEIDSNGGKEHTYVLQDSIRAQPNEFFYYGQWETQYFKINFRDDTNQSANYRSTVSFDAAGITNSLFGQSVSIGCDKVVIGAPKDTADGVANKGAVYIAVPNYDESSKLLPDFFAPTTTFYPSPEGIGYGYASYQKITRNDSNADTYYGYSVSCACERIAVGAPRDNQVASYSGAVFLYDLGGNLIKKLVLSEWGNSSSNMYFGHSVAIGSGRVVVGAYNESSGAGAIYIYDLEGNKIRKITASDAQAGDYFGWSVAVGAGRIVVGAPGDDDNGSNAGAAYILDIGGNEIKKVKATAGAAGHEFGRAVAAGFERVVVGAPKESHSGYTNNGAAYVFSPNGTLIKRVVAGNINDPSGNSQSNFNGGQFAASVAIGDGKIIFGQPYANRGLSSKLGSLWETNIDAEAELKVRRISSNSTNLVTVSLANNTTNMVSGQYVKITGNIYPPSPGTLDGVWQVSSIISANTFTLQFGQNVGQATVITDSTSSNRLGYWIHSDSSGNPSGSTIRIGLGAERFDPFDGVSTNDTYGVSCAVGCGVLAVGGTGIQSLDISGAYDSLGNVVGKVKIGKSIGNGTIFAPPLFTAGTPWYDPIISSRTNFNVLRRKKSFLDSLDKK